MDLLASLRSKARSDDPLRHAQFVRQDPHLRLWVTGTRTHKGVAPGTAGVSPASLASLSVVCSTVTDSRTAHCLGPLRHHSIKAGARTVISRPSRSAASSTPRIRGRAPRLCAASISRTVALGILRKHGGHADGESRAFEFAEVCLVEHLADFHEMAASFECAQSWDDFGATEQSRRQRIPTTHRKSEIGQPREIWARKKWRQRRQWRHFLHFNTRGVI